MTDYWDCEDKGEDIICPYCKERQDVDSMYYYVTYWGDDGDHRECSCGSCGENFMVIERVERTFGTYKAKEVLGK